ncbi:MAG: DUF1570 domain-containing protein [Planctomycetes bacterium]|nr:DUF1570 domain-containing protein [Planctomycetota bacterium]
MIRLRTFAASLFLAASALLPAVSVSAQTVAAPAGDDQHDRVEVVRLKSGKVLRGLIESRTKTHLDFIEFFRPLGKPMFAVARRIERRHIAREETLSEDQRAALVRQASRFRNRARIEQGRMESISLARSEVDGVTHWTYRPLGQRPFFTLRSSMDEQMTRRAIVRIEQIFTAYRRLMPPRAAPRKQLQMVLFGSMQEYRDFLGSRQLDIDHPAFYSTRRNLIAAGSQLDGLRSVLQKSQAKQTAILQEIERMKKTSAKTLRQLNAELKKRGVDTETRKLIVGERRQRVETELQRLRKQARANDRHNAAKFDTVTARMFTRLYHEAFHAYLENYVYPGEQHDVPRWLNEGMAQVFEQGQLDDGMLRIDAPNRQALVKLQALLRSNRATSLADVLSAKQSAFLVTHTRGTGSREHYLISWGLTYYLTFDRPLLSREAIDRYTRPEAAKTPPVARFERLVGMSLKQFEQDWRKAMLAKLPQR